MATPAEVARKLSRQNLEPVAFHTDVLESQITALRQAAEPIKVETPEEGFRMFDFAIRNLQVNQGSAAFLHEEPSFLPVSRPPPRRMRAFFPGRGIVYIPDPMSRFVHYDGDDVAMQFENQQARSGRPSTIPAYRPGAIQ